MSASSTVVSNAAGLPASPGGVQATGHGYGHASGPGSGPPSIPASASPSGTASGSLPGAVTGNAAGHVGGAGTAADAVAAAASAAVIRFYHRGAIVSVSDAAPTRTVLQHLREDLQCTGTKEGCAEGDCGACTVVVGELRGEQLVLNTVNACIQLLPTLDGKALFTVEDLQAADGALHPVQQAMVECHGSQCGFCTPGFVMSLWSLYLQREQEADIREAAAAAAFGSPSCPAGTGATAACQSRRREVDAALSGNLCRCTGYRPIIAAARRMQELPAVRFDRDAVKTALAGLRRSNTASLSYSRAGQHFLAPATLSQLLRLRAALPQALLLAGSTDVGLWITKQLRQPETLIYLGQVEALNTLVQQDDHLEIGAGVSLEQAYAALSRFYGAGLGQLWQRFASQPIRNAGTLGGNVANGSPIGDSMPWLIALGASVVLRSSRHERVLPLEDFYLAYQKKDLHADEIVFAVRVPLPRPERRFRTYKLAKRFDQDISAVCAAFVVSVNQQDLVTEARFAFGGMAATPKRAALAEAALLGQAFGEAAVEAAAAMLASDYAPLSDMRAGSAYRLQAAQNLLRRFWLETRSVDALPSSATNVFA